jgi:hypothetical protein
MSAAKGLWLALLVATVATAGAARAAADPVQRLVVIKADGLPQHVLDRAVRERNPRTGRSMLPWIELVFYREGTRLSNFYVRGMSLSGPSWSMLDTGQHLQIRSNVEFDRYTQHPYDYLNFIPFWLDNARQRQGDMWGTSVLDDLGIPLLLDAYEFDERYQSFQLFQRGSRWLTLSEALQRRVTSRSARQLFDEWQVGIEGRAILTDQLERELIANLANPTVRYLDYYTTEYDHDAHHNRDWATHLAALQRLDRLVGRISAAIAETAQADTTALVLLSDHGVNSNERVFSQGYSLVTLLGSTTGGGHHVVTKRRPMNDYSVKGIYPLVPLITTTSAHSTYLKGQSEYQTALVDFDGNERASIHLRHSVLNVLHVLLQELTRRDLPADRRAAIEDAFLDQRDRRAATWRQTVDGMRLELDGLRAGITTLRDQLAAFPAPHDEDDTPEPPQVVQARVRLIGRIEAWERDERRYADYLESLDRLATLTREGLRDSRLRVEDLIPKGAMGDRNDLYDIQHYVTGPAPGGLVFRQDGSLDMERSFTRVDYLQLLTGLRVRNNVQPGLSNAPVDFTVVRLPCNRIAGLPDGAEAPDTCIWLNGGGGAEALVLARTDAIDGLLLKYLPVARLAASEDGSIRFEAAGFRPGLPLGFMEDPGLQLPHGTDRHAWLGEWHTDAEWLDVTHAATYSNAIVGLHEQIASHPAPTLDPDAEGLTESERLLRRFRLRQRALVEPDILVLASNHWNFDVRGFNPGGNHGSFFRPSTRSTFMVSGGARTGIPRGLNVERPYDSLSFVPTMLALIGELEWDGRPSPALAERGFQPFPGRVVEELLGGADRLEFRLAD